MQDDDGDELAAFQAADAARGALQADQQGGAIEGFVQGSQVTLLIASTQNAGIFGTDGGNREDMFNLIAEAAGGKDKVVKDFLTSEGGEYSHSKLTCAIFVCIDQETADRVRAEAQRRKFGAFTWAEAGQDPRLASFTQGVVTLRFSSAIFPKGQGCAFDPFKESHLAWLVDLYLTKWQDVLPTQPGCAHLAGLAFNRFKIVRSNAPYKADSGVSKACDGLTVLCRPTARPGDAPAVSVGVTRLTKVIPEMPLNVALNDQQNGFIVTKRGLFHAKRHHYGIPLHKGWCPFHATVHPDGKGGVRCHQYAAFLRSITTRRPGQSYASAVGSAPGP